MNALGWAAAALDRGVDVYLFLIGMMALAEVAAAGGLFTWIAERAVRAAGGSRFRLFALVYGSGIVTTTFLSNDATIVVLTPAVIAALARVDASPAAYVTACALVANAASFVLPIANPSNLLVFAGRMPSLFAWLAAFTVPSIAALAVTFGVSAWWFRRDLRGRATVRSGDDASAPSRAIAVALAVTAAGLVTTSARAGPIGAATFGCAVASSAVAVFARRTTPADVVRGIAWPVIALTAALFVVIGGIDAAGGLRLTRALLAWCASQPGPAAPLATGYLVAAASNLVNNLPVGLNLGETLPALHAPPTVTNAALIGVNLGPNASVNGSLATILWLGILRRNGIRISAWQFAALGSLAAGAALLAALLLVR